MRPGAGCAFGIKLRGSSQISPQTCSEAVQQHRGEFTTPISTTDILHVSQAASPPASA
jgi:hypothetical protein